jgi:hypothetical protein
MELVQEHHTETYMSFNRENRENREAVQKSNAS